VRVRLVLGDRSASSGVRDTNAVAQSDYRGMSSRGLGRSDRAT